MNSPMPCPSPEDPVSKATHKYIVQDLFFPFGCKNDITEYLKVVIVKTNCTSRLILILVHVQAQQAHSPSQGQGWCQGISPAWLMATPLKSTIRK